MLFSPEAHEPLADEPWSAERARAAIVSIVADAESAFELVNWPPVEGRALDASGDGLIGTQWCHGAPGLVATLAHVMDEELAVAGGELTWRAGPLRKGPGLCHGTAGNGYAFLALHNRTGDERWLTRARAFAMHAARQVEHARERRGQSRYTLWTGELGAALFLADCIDGDGKPPLP